MKLHRVWAVLAMALVLAVMSVWPVGAQTDVLTPPAKLPGIFYNPILLAVVGIIIQFVPKVRTLISNYAIPYITTFLAWLSGLFAPEASHAMGGPVAAMVAALPMFGLGGLLGGLGAAVAQSVQGYLIQRMFAWPGRTLPPLPNDSRGAYK